MSVIIRLQGLPWLANALDIRRYFQGLVIPEGGVHIVGGELGDAFIAFGTDEDARQAMQRDGGKIKDTRIKLLLSSRTEMQKVIDLARNPSMGMPAMIAPAQPQPAVPEIGRARSPEHRAPERRDPVRREHPERPAERSREKDRDRNRDRRRRTKSRSRSPRRGRDREVKRKDERNRGADDRDNRAKRDEPRKRSETRDLKQPAKENTLNPMANPLLGSGPGMGNVNVPSNNRFPFKQDPAIPPAGRNQEQWPSSAPISPWINQPEGFMPMQQQMEKKDWSSRSEMDQYGMQRQMGWNENEPGRDMKSDRMGKEGFNSRPAENFMGRTALLEKPTREQEFGGVGREPFSRENTDMMDRRQHGSNMPVGRRDQYDGREQERLPRESRFSQMDTRRSESFGLNGRGGAERRPEAFGGRDFGSSYDGLHSRQPASDSFSATSDGFGMRSGSHGDSRMDFRNSGALNDQFEVPAKRARGGLCVELRGIPYSATPKDILDFLRGIRIAPNNLKLLGDDRSFKITSAVIRFSNEEDLDEALRRNRQYMGSRYVEVVPCSDSYFDNAVNLFPDYFNDKRAPEDTSTCILVKGLPFDCKEDDIHKLFADHNLKVADVLIEFDRTGLPTGNCFVEFMNNNDAKQASMIRTKMGHKYIDIFVVEKERMMTAKSFMEKSGQRTSLMQDSAQPGFVRNTDCCLLQGLPFTASDRDIVRFFSTVNIMPVTIHIMLTKTGQPSGDAFCEFKSVKDCEVAMRKNNHQMEKHFINVKPVSRNEMLDALGLLNKPDAGVNPPGRLYDDRINDRHGMSSSVMDRSHADRAPFDRLSMSEGLMSHDRGHMQGRHALHDQLSPMNRTPLQERPSGDHLQMHERRLDRLPMDRSFDRMPLDRHSLLDRGDRGDFGIKDRSIPEGVPRGLQGFGLPGCVVALQNLPYQATVQDIMNFFKKYGITQETIIRRYNDKGQPTGDARVAFRSPADAQQAVMEMNMQTLNGRSISVSRVYDR